MFLYHVSPARNRDSIERHGIMLGKARNQDRPRVWLCEAARIGWAVRHVMDRHNVVDGGVDVWIVHVERGTARMTHLEGVWNTGLSIGADSLSHYAYHGDSVAQAARQEG